MSNFSSAHNIESYNPATSRALSEQRLVIINYKARTEKDQLTGETIKLPKFPSLCVSIPFLKLTVSSLTPVAQLQAITLNLWESLQDDLIRSIIDQKRMKSDPSVSLKSSITDDEINLAAIAAFAAATGTGKLSGDSIGSWFDNVLAECIIAALMLSNPDRTDEQVAAILTNYRSAMQKLAAVQPGLPAAAQQQLRKALATAPEDDQMAPRLMQKLDSMNKSSELVLEGL